MKYYFWILGCAMNYSDAERMATVLESLGYTKTEKESEADLFIVISCSVRESAMLSIYGKVKDLIEYRIQNPKFRTILTGCVLEKDRKKLTKAFDVIMTIEDLPKLPGLLSPNSPVIPIERMRTEESLRKYPDITEGSLQQGRDDNEEESYLSITPHYESSFRAYVPISTGCDNFCSYCAVPYTKGREKSRPMDEIVTEVTNLVKNGFKEITLLGQNVNSYGHDFLSPTSLRSLTAEAISNDERDCRVVPPRNDGEIFAQLLLELDKIPGDHRIYFYSNHPKDMTDELINTIATLKHFPHYLHLPLQSGNDEVLKKMNRHNTKKKYLDLVAKIRKAMPDVTLTTDIIVGFPGETEEQFADTADVMQHAQYDMAFIAQYSPRPGTVSAKLSDDVPKVEKIRREKLLQEIVKATVLEHNKKLVGTTQRVLVDEVKVPSSSQRRLGSSPKYYGRTEGFKVVEITLSPTSLRGTKQSLVAEGDCRVVPPRNDVIDKTDLIGRFVDVKIDSVGSWKLFGTISQQ